jgi:hypothetical protein
MPRPEKLLFLTLVISTYEFIIAGVQNLVLSVAKGTLLFEAIQRVFC